MGAPYTDAYATGYGPRSATKSWSRMLLGVPRSRTLVKYCLESRYQCSRLRVPRTSRTRGIRPSGIFRMESQSARVSSLSMRGVDPFLPREDHQRRPSVSVVALNVMSTGSRNLFSATVGAD